MAEETEDELLQMVRVDASRSSRSRSPRWRERPPTSPLESTPREIAITAFDATANNDFLPTPLPRRVPLPGDRHVPAAGGVGSRRRVRL